MPSAGAQPSLPAGSGPSRPPRARSRRSGRRAPAPGSRSGRRRARARCWLARVCRRPAGGRRCAARRRRGRGSRGGPSPGRSRSPPDREAAGLQTQILGCATAVDHRLDQPALAAIEIGFEQSPSERDPLPVRSPTRRPRCSASSAAPARRSRPRRRRRACWTPRSAPTGPDARPDRRRGSARPGSPGRSAARRSRR